MSFAFMPFYTGDYLRDTMHLSCAEHGIYCKLLFYCWDQQGPVPLDERKLVGIVNARSTDEIEALRRVLEEFFVMMDDGWYNRRMQHELERANSISLKRKSAGAKGYQARAKHLPSKSLASASTLTPTPTPTTTPTTTGVDLELSQRSLPIGSEPQVSSAPTPADSTGVWIPLVDKSEWSVPLAFLAELETAYPDVIGLLTLREIRVWCLSNPQKCKTARGVKRFINRWFEKEQNHG